MTIDSDVIVVGGGPCGSFAALNIAEHGAGVTVFEEHNEVGVPSHCPGHLSIKGLRDLGLYPLPEGIVENSFAGAIFHSPNGKRFSVRLSSPVTCAVNRALFDRHIANLAEDAGVRYCLGKRVESLIIENGVVEGVSVSQAGREERFSAKLVVDAEGVSSRLLRQTGLTLLSQRRIVSGVDAEIEYVNDAESDMVEVFLGKEFAPGFYAWLVPICNGRAKVGLAANSGNPKEFLRKFIEEHPVASKKLGKAQVSKMAFHPITLGGMIPRAYSDGFLAVGDVASQVKPTTGGGVVLGMNCGKVAAEVACTALRERDFSAELLGAYQKRCKEFLSFDLRFMLRARKLLDSMPDEKLDQTVELCAKLGLEKALQRVGDIDFQGRSFLRALGNPRMLAVLGCFFYFFLSANP
jgi:geranylgeranyl reductase family protein